MLLSEMSNALCWAQGLTSDAVAEILATLTRSETKVASAEKLLDDAMKLYAIPAEDKWSIIDGLINPQERRLTESMLRKY